MFSRDCTHDVIHSDEARWWSTGRWDRSYEDESNMLGRSPLPSTEDPVKRSLQSARVCSMIGFAALEDYHVVLLAVGGAAHGGR
jgi:hypothetical protein